MTGSGTELDPYIIYDITDLQNMQNDLDAYYELANDIDASVTSSWNGGAGFVPIDGFTGDFNGNYHSISGLYMNWANTYIHLGLFTTLGSHPIVRNVRILNAHITNTGTSGSYGLATGVLVGRIYTDDAGAAISRVYVSGQVHASHNNYGEGCAAGGMIGMVDYDIWTQYCTFDECAADVDVTLTNGWSGSGCRAMAGGFLGTIGSGVPSAGVHFYNCYARGAVSASGANFNYAGGFVGVHITYTYPTGYIDNCYSTGAPSAASTGGFGATCVASKITDCFWDIQTSGQGTSCAGTGKTTAEMKTQSTFTDASWDFVNIWAIDGTGVINDGYPYLAAIPPPVLLGGYIWVEGTKFAYLDASRQKRLKEGALTGTTGKIPGHYGVEGDYLHCIDSSGAERRILGTLSGLTGKIPAQISVNTKSPMLGTNLCYIDSSGNERCFEGT